MKKSKIITLILSLSMIVAISMSTVAFAEGSGENYQGNLYYKTHYISTNALVKDDIEGAPSRFFLQADMPIEITFTGTDVGDKPNLLQSIYIEGYSSSARNMPQGTVVYGDCYESFADINNVKNYSTGDNIFEYNLPNTINSHLSDSSNFNKISSVRVVDEEHSVFTTGYSVIRSDIPVFDEQGNLTGETTLGMIDYFSQYTYFSENPAIPYTCFTVGSIPLDLSSDIYFKECYYYGFNNNYGTYYNVFGNQVGAFRVFCWSNSSDDLAEFSLSNGFYLLIPSSIPSILVTRNMLYNGIGQSIHLSYTTALGSQLDNVAGSWYEFGLETGMEYGINIGYEQGYQIGVDVGYQNGLGDGRLEQTFTFERLIFSVLEAPVKVLLSTFDDIQILGLDVKSTIISVLTITMILFIVRFVSSLLQANTSIENANSPSSTGTNSSIGSNHNLSSALNSKKPNRTVRREWRNQPPNKNWYRTKRTIVEKPKK